MKAQIKKFAALAFSMCLLLSLMVVGASAGETTSYYERVTTAPADWSGEYLIVYENGTKAKVFNSGLSNPDVTQNHFEVNIVDGKIEANANTNAAKVTIAKSGSGYSVKMANGKYTGGKNNDNKLYNSTSVYAHTLSMNSDKSVNLVSNTSYLRFNPTTGNSNNRFRYYKSTTYTTQKPVHLYKLTTVAGGGEGEGEGGNEGEGEGEGSGSQTPTYTPPAADSVLTIPQALEVGQKIAAGETVTNSYYVVGEIKNVYNTQYGNMWIKDAQGNEICIYGLNKNGVRYDAMTTKPVAGDTIKVYGPITVYNGAGQFASAELIDHTPATPAPGEGEGEGGGTTPPASDPAADSTLTIEQAIALGNTKDKDVYTDGKYYIEGTVKSIENPTYGNMYVEDANGNKILVYGVYNNDGTVGYSSMDPKPVAGDTVKLYGVIGKYNEPQMKNAWLIEMQSAGGQAPVAPSDPKQIVDEAFALESGKYLAYSATLTGTVKEIQDPYNEQYRNVTFVMTVEGTTGEKDLLCYRVKTDDASIDLSALAVGDKVTVTGAIKNHNDIIEYDTSGRVTAIVPADNDDNQGGNQGGNQGDADEDDEDDDIIGGGDAEDEDEDIIGGGDAEDEDKEVPATGDSMQTILVVAMLVMLTSAAALVLTGKKVRG